MRASLRVVAATALSSACLAGCAGARPRIPPPMYPRSHLPVAAPSGCAGVEPHGSPAGFLHTHFSSAAWQEGVGAAWQREEFALPLALGAASLFTRVYDTKLEDAAKNSFRGNQLIGDTGVEALVATSVAIGALRPREGRTVRDELWTQAEAFALTFGINQGVKYAIGRRRPDLSDFSSFPSGHTSMAFCAATLIERNAGPALGIPAYGAALVTGFSRIESGRHFTSDVLAGAALGTAVAIAIDSLHFGDGSPGSGICGCAGFPELGCGTDPEGRPALWLSLRF